MRNTDAGSAAERLASRLIVGVPVTGRRLHVAGVSTAVLEGGSGPSVILLHGHGGFAESFVNVFAGLVDGFHVVAPDLPSFGRSEPPGGQLGPSLLPEWLRQLVLATCATAPTLVGVSAGAGVAVRHVLDGGRRAAGAVLVGPRWSHAVPMAVRAAVWRFERSPSRETADRVARHVMFDADVTRRRLGARASILEDYLIERACRPGVRAANRALPSVVADDSLARIDVPVAVICGRHDRVVPVRHAARRCAELGWPLAVVDAAGHLPHLEQPAAFVAALRSALDPDQQPPHREEQP